MIDLPARDRPVLVTDRLELWIPQEHELEHLIAIVSDPRTHRYLGPAGSHADHFTRILRNAGSWVVYGYGSFVVKRRGESRPIGSCGIFHSYRGLGNDFDDLAEAGWIIDADEVRSGYASEAMRTAFDWFDSTHGLQKVVCMIDVENVPSIALARKLGFHEMREARLDDGDTVLLMLRDPRNPT